MNMDALWLPPCCCETSELWSRSLKEGVLAAAEHGRLSMNVVDQVYGLLNTLLNVPAKLECIFYLYTLLQSHGACSLCT